MELLLFFLVKQISNLDYLGFIAMQAEASLEQSQGLSTLFLVCHIFEFQLQTKENLFPLACERTIPGETVASGIVTFFTV